jgi:hypothetical protein
MSEANQITVTNRYYPGIRAEDLYTSTAIQNLNNMPFPDYQKYFQGYIAEATDYRRRDTRVIAAGETIAQKKHLFFNVVAGKTEKTLGETVSYTKDEGECNMVDSSRMEHNTFLIVESLQVNLLATSRDYSVIGADGQPTVLSVAAEASNSAVNTVIGLVRNSYLRFKVGKHVKAEGRLTQFPSDEIYSGAFGQVADEGFFQIGVGMPRPLKEIVVLEPGANFTMELELFRAVTVPQNVELSISLVGVLLEDVA